MHEHDISSLNTSWVKCMNHTVWYTVYHFPYITSENAVFDMSADLYSGGQCDGSIQGGLVPTFFVDYQFRQML